MPLALSEQPAWLVVELIAAIPFVVVPLVGFAVARRWGRKVLLLGGAVWAVLGFALAELLDTVPLPAAISIAVFLFATPWLLAGGLGLLTRRRRPAVDR